MRRARAIMVAAGVCGVIVAVTGAASPGTWHFQTPPIPGTSSSNLMSVSCKGAIRSGGPSFCMAVGSYKVKANPDTGQTNKAVPLADEWNGTKWTDVPVSVPQPRDHGSALTAVSCTSNHQCMAVGYKADGGGGLAEQWKGSTGKWTIVPAAGASGSISCSSASACTAGGAGIERWNGTKWSVQSNPMTSNGDSVEAVSCPNDTSCTAIGGPNGLNAEQWNGTTWSLLPDAPPAGDDSFLLGLSCISAGTCTAVGENFPSGTNGSTAVAERLNGSNWTIQQTAALPGANNAELDSVSCTATHACVAVGYNDIGKPTAAMAEEWDGTSWTVDNPIPGPATETSSQLFGVSCLGGIGGACTAVGSYGGPQGGQHAFAATK
jgi:hypothetical protein